MLLVFASFIYNANTATACKYEKNDKQINNIIIPCKNKSSSEELTYNNRYYLYNYMYIMLGYSSYMFIHNSYYVIYFTLYLYRLKYFKHFCNFVYIS